MSDHADFNGDAHTVLREAMASTAHLIAESRRIKAECDARVLDSLIVMFRSDALVCASKIERRSRKLDEGAEMIGGSHSLCVDGSAEPVLADSCTQRKRS